jgi:probable phosphoglycerate mutase
LILSSRRRRALETAELAAFVGPHEPQIDEDLAEWFYRNFEGKTARKSGDGPGWTIWTSQVPGGESAAQVAAQLDRVVARIRASGLIRRSALNTATRCGRAPCAGSV